MSKVLTFSRTFPAYHPKKGQPTYFVEAILTQLGIDYVDYKYFVFLCENNADIDRDFLNDFWLSLKPNIDPKGHTIRNHVNPLKAGQFINPKCWAEKPYNKTKEGYWQIKFTPDIEVKKTFDFKIEVDNDYKCILIDDWSFYEENKDFFTQHEALEILAKNDGLSVDDMKAWFKWGKSYTGKIYCWNEKIDY